MARSGDDAGRAELGQQGVEVGLHAGHVGGGAIRLRSLLLDRAGGGTVGVDEDDRCGVHVRGDVPRSDDPDAGRGIGHDYSLLDGLSGHRGKTGQPVFSPLGYLTSAVEPEGALQNTETLPQLASEHTRSHHLRSRADDDLLAGESP